MEIRDPHFDEIQVPSFVLSFQIFDIFPENKFPNSIYQKNDYNNASLLEKILMEFRSFPIIDCKLKNNGLSRLHELFSLAMFGKQLILYLFNILNAILSYI
jgi:hypothetical protein